MTSRTKKQHPMGEHYPLRWQDFVGQERAKNQLITAAKSAKVRKAPMAHALIGNGSPGIGKTALGCLAGMERGTNIRIASGKIKAADARLLFADMQDGDVLLIDEFHLLVSGNSKDAEWLLNYLQDGMLLGPYGVEVQPKVTIIGCTTEPGALQKTILDRFLRITLVPYTEAEGTQIARTTAKRIFAGYAIPSAKDCARVASAASNNPRIMGHILTQMRDLVLVHGMPVNKSLATALDWMGLTPDGLTTTAVEYLKVLLEDYGAEPAGASALADRLEEPGGLKDTETLLMDKGLMAKTPRGRCLTQAGIKRTKELAGR